MTLPQLQSALRASGIVGEWVMQDRSGPLGAEKGAYILALELSEPTELTSKKLAGLVLEPGWYLYAGSAKGPGGLRARLQRHLQTEKKMHWHIDQLTTTASKLQALAVQGGDECDLVAKLLERPEIETAAPGFGSTDCQRCLSHLLALA